MIQVPTPPRAELDAENDWRTSMARTLWSLPGTPAPEPEAVDYGTWCLPRDYGEWAP